MPFDAKQLTGLVVSCHDRIEINELTSVSMAGR